jgi:ATP-binding cassette subfamily B protein/ATP-binding cassette subfamily C protein
MVGAVVGVILPRIRAAVTRTQEAVGVLGAALDRALGAARAVKGNAAEARETARIDRASEQGYQAGLVGARYSALVTVVTELSLQVSFLVVLGVGGAFVAAGSLPVSTLVAFLLALFYLTAPIASPTGGATQLQQGLGAVTRLREVTGLEVEEDVDAASSHASPSTARRVSRAPQIRYEPSTGTIYLDNCDIAEMSRAELRSHLAWVDQDSSALSGTLAENLRFGAPEATDDDLRAVLSEVRLEDLIERLPEGWHSEIGGRGAAISGGDVNASRSPAPFSEALPCCCSTKRARSSIPSTNSSCGERSSSSRR